MKRMSIVRLAAAVLIATTSTVAFAYVPRTAAPASPAPAQFQDAETCSIAQNAVIEEAFAEARRRVERAIAFIHANPGHAHIRTWFGEGAKVNYVRASLVRIAEGMKPENRPAIYCGTRACSVFGRAWPGQNTMSVCSRFFKALESGTDARFGVIIHEISHLVIRTGDHAYGPAAARALAERDASLAATNADNFEYFVEHLPETPAS